MQKDVNRKQDMPERRRVAQVTETFEEALTGASSFGIQPGLVVMERLMAELGNPQEKLPVIHVAGTNGKGSVSAMLESIFRHAGYKTGLYTSPHLISYGERFKINGKSAAEDQLLSILLKVKKSAEKVATELGRGPTEFEILTAMAFLYFLQEKVDVLILEVGLGGRLDATNIITRPLATVITNISFDHENFLGNTLEAIAFEKAGIIKPGVSLISAVREEEIQNVIKKVFMEKQNKAREEKGRIYWVQETCRWQVLKEELFTQELRLSTVSHIYQDLILPLAGVHQCINLATAVLTAEILKPFFYKLDEEAVFAGVKNVRWPCRIEPVSSNPAIVLDGAHNPAGMETLALWLQKHKESFRQVILVMGMLKDKNRRETAKKLEALVDRIIITRPPSYRALEWEKLAGEFSGSKQDRIQLIEDNLEALRAAQRIAETDDLILVTGSLYLVGALRRYFE